jgi:hypothetical protein
VTGIEKSTPSPAPQQLFSSNKFLLLKTQHTAYSAHAGLMALLLWLHGMMMMARMQ